MSQFVGQNQDGTYGTFDWTKLGAIIPRATQTPVLCKDGTTDFSLSSPNARYDNSKVCANKGGIADTFRKVRCNDGTIQNQRSSQNAEYIDACLNNGGTSKNQTSVAPTEKVNLSPEFNLSPEEKFYQSLGIKSKGGWSFSVIAKGRFYLVVVLVAGYFAYKKFKK